MCGPLYVAEHLNINITATDPQSQSFIFPAVLSLSSTCTPADTFLIRSPVYITFVWCVFMPQFSFSSIVLFRVVLGLFFQPVPPLFVKCGEQVAGTGPMQGQDEKTEHLQRFN